MKKLAEYNTDKSVTAQEFEQWKATWKQGQLIPDTILAYISKTILPIEFQKIQKVDAFIDRCVEK